MPLVLKYDLAGPMAQVAMNVGQFATDRTLNAENLRERAFANDVAQSQAQMSLGGVGQGFQMRQQLAHDAFQREQAAIQNGFRQQDFDAQNQYRNDSLAVNDAYRRDALGAQLQRAQVQGDYGLQREGLRQYGADQRNQEDNDLKLILQQNNIDWRTANADQVNAARQHLQQMRGQQMQDLEQMRFGNRSTLQDDQQTFLAGQQDQRLNQQQGQFNQRQGQQQSQFDQRMQQRPTNMLPEQREQRIAWNQQLDNIRAEAQWLMQQHPVQKDFITGAPMPRPPAVEQRLSELAGQYRSLASQLAQVAPPGQMPNVQQVYQQPAPQQAPAPQQPIDPAMAGQQSFQAPDGSFWTPTGQYDQNGQMIYQRVQ